MIASLRTGRRDPLRQVCALAAAPVITWPTAPGLRQGKHLARSRLMQSP